MENLEKLVRRWFAGWQASRDLPAAEATEDGLWIHCRQASREFEAFTLHADEDPGSISRMAARVLAMTETTWLTSATSHPERTTSALEAAGLELLHRAEWFMSIDLAEHPRQDLDPAYSCDVRAEGAAVTVTICDDSGELAARGQLGLAGEDAVPDRIETMPNHRRRGLGGVVMGVLAAEAVARGARTGLLIASTDGQHLYTKLGWGHVADVVIAKAPAASS
jgi:GNAT superfamily N-acetyltransferase